MNILSKFFKSKKDEQIVQPNSDSISKNVEHSKNSNIGHGLIDSLFLEYAAKNPAFAGMDVSKITFHPVDNDIIRMGMYGCYAGDKFSYEGVVHTINEDQVQHISVMGDEETKKRIFSGDLRNGDKVQMDYLDFYYGEFKETEEDEMYGYYYSRETIIKAEKPGWVLQCNDYWRTIPDVYIPDTVLGIPVENMSKAFCGKRNVVNISHIPASIVHPDQIRDAFDYCGIRKVPDGLSPECILASCDAAYNLVDYEKTIMSIDSASSETIGAVDTRHIYEEKELIERLKENKKSELELLETEFSPYQKYELVSFVYKFEPVVIARAQDYDGNWYAISPASSAADYAHNNGIAIPYQKYMSKFDMSYVSDLTTNSFKPLSVEEGIKLVSECYDVRIEMANEELKKAIKDLIDTRTSMIKNCATYANDLPQIPVPSIDEILDILNSNNGIKNRNEPLEQQTI